MTKEEIEKIFDESDGKRIRFTDTEGVEYTGSNEMYEDDRTTDSGEGEICFLGDKGEHLIVRVSDVESIAIIQ